GLALQFERVSLTSLALTQGQIATLAAIDSLTAGLKNVGAGAGQLADFYAAATAATQTFADASQSALVGAIDRVNAALRTQDETLDAVMAEATAIITPIGELAEMYGRLGASVQTFNEASVSAFAGAFDKQNAAILAAD